MIDLETKKLKYRVVQSPMAGCTDLAFRVLSRRYGMEFCFLEMISANGLMHESRNTRDLMKTIPEDRPVGAQLIGCEPETMAAAAAKLVDHGFDILDLNLGCPVRKMTSQGAGAAMLKDPENTRAVFEKVVKAVKNVPVTVKVRKGYEDESGAEAVRIARIAEDAGLSAITVHGRTRAQGYTGKADWEAIGKVKAAVKIPVIGNGDVLSADDARRMREVSGCDGVMIGRGGLGNPWIYKAIQEELFEGRPANPPTLEERRAVALEHLDLEVRFEGAERAVFHMRRIGGWYLEGVYNASHWRAQLNRCATIEDIRRVLAEALSPAFSGHVEVPTAHP